MIFPGTYSGDSALFLTLLFAAIHLSDRHTLSNPARISLRSGRIRLLLSTVLVPAVAVLLVNGWSLQYRVQEFRQDQAVRKVDSLDLDSLAFDTANSVLYATGHGTDYLLAYDVLALPQAPRRSQVTTGHAQSFSYNPADHELYVFNADNDTLLILAEGTLEQKMLIRDLHMTKGDSRIVYDRYTSTLIIASEGSYWGEPSDESGYPIAVVDRDSGAIRYTVKDCEGLCIPGLIEIHPSKPLLYLVFPKKVLLYNTLIRKVIAKAPIKGHWVDGMAITPDEKELLLGVPLSSTVLRLDAETLQSKGSYSTVFGVRTLAVDPGRNLLLAASLATNNVDVIDLNTHEELATYYISPWLRAISLDTRAGVAYISSTEGLFRLNYTARLRQRS
jgi:DNA-binding beta-propeller fold protein YncE